MNDKWLKTAEELANRPYFIKVVRDETTEGEPIYVAHAPELEGCFGQGDNPRNAVADLKTAMIDFIVSLLEDDIPVPDPAELEMTTSTTTSKTFTVTNYTTDNNIVSNPQQKNIYIPAG